MKENKTLMTLLLAFVMLLGIFQPVTALAEEEKALEGVQISELPVQGQEIDGEPDTFPLVEIDGQEFNMVPLERSGIINDEFIEGIGPRSMSYQASALNT